MGTMHHRGSAVKPLLRAALVLASLAALAPSRPSPAQTPQPPAATPAPAVEAPARPAPNLPRGDFEVTVVAADGKKFRDCTVYANDQVVSFGESGGPLLAKGIPIILDASYAVTADARVPQGGDKPPKRYVGVTEAMPTANKIVKVKVTLKPAEDIDAYCATCHPGRGQRAKAGQMKRDVHPTGKPLAGRYREQVGKYNARVEALRKEGKPHGEPIILEERIVVEGGKEVRREFYTCESCHTLHWKTPHTKYARANFREQGELCTGCHY